MIKQAKYQACCVTFELSTISQQLKTQLINTLNVHEAQEFCADSIIAKNLQNAFEGKELTVKNSLPSRNEHGLHDNLLESECSSKIEKVVI